MRSFCKCLLIFIVIAAPFAAVAATETTAKGKIVFTQGHRVPDCRTVEHVENATGTVRFFRIQDVQGHDDVSAVALSALMSGRDTTITYDPAVTTGCGSEPSIEYITVY